MLWSMLYFLILLEPPKPLSSWTVSLEVTQALVDEQGETYLFSGDSLATYDREGNVKQRVQFSKPVGSAMFGPDESLWLHDGAHELRLLDKNLQEQFAMELPPPNLNCAVVDAFLLYPTVEALYFISPAAKLPVASIRVTGGLAAYMVRDHKILFLDQSGKVGYRNADGQIGETRWKSPLSGVRFLVADGANRMAAVVGSSHLYSLNEKGRVRWQRDFHIGITMPPRVLEWNKKRWTGLVSLSRKLVLYDSHGSPVYEFLMPARPLLFEQIRSDLLLCIPQFQKVLYWLNGKDLKVQSENLDFSANALAQSSNYLVLLGSNGTIRLYSKK